MRFKDPSSPSDSGIPLPRPGVRRRHRENHRAVTELMQRQKGQRRGQGVISASGAAARAGTLTPGTGQSQALPRAQHPHHQHSMQTHQSSPTVPLGACRPPLLASTARPRLLLGRKAKTSAGRCQMPAGRARAWASSPDLLGVRAKPWLSRNT